MKIAPGGEQPAVFPLTDTYANLIAHLNAHFSLFYFTAVRIRGKGGGVTAWYVNETHRKHFQMNLTNGSLCDLKTTATASRAPRLASWSTELIENLALTSSDGLVCCVLTLFSLHMNWKKLAQCQTEDTPTPEDTHVIYLLLLASQLAAELFIRTATSSGPVPCVKPQKRCHAVMNQIKWNVSRLGKPRPPPCAPKTPPPTSTVETNTFMCPICFPLALCQIYFAFQHPQGKKNSLAVALMCC